MSKFKFYSQEEIKDLKPFIEGTLSASEANLKDFCKKHNRAFRGVAQMVYKEKRKFRIAHKVTKKAILSKSEFHIPINKWELVNTDSGITLVLKFN